MRYMLQQFSQLIYLSAFIILMINQIPELRTIIGVRRSGTTALVMALSEHPDIGTIAQPVLSGYRYGDQKKPDYSVYERNPDNIHPKMKQNPKPFYVTKETIGAAKVKEGPGQINLKFFPNDAAIKRTKPLFIVRDPFQGWASWKKLKWANLKVFLDSYKKVFELFKDAKRVTPDTTAVTYEHLMTHPKEVLKKICSHWGLPYSDAMVDWKKGYNSQRIGTAKGTAKILKNSGSRDRLKISKKFGGINLYDLSSLSPEEKSIIEKQLMPIYKKFKSMAKTYFPIVKEATAKAAKKAISV
jgi:hypothetical protein